MILPTVAALSQDALHQIPYKVKPPTAWATRWDAIQGPPAHGQRRHLQRFVLGFGRALGETMALAMLIGNANQISLSLFAPANTLASLMASNFPEAGGKRAALMSCRPRAAGRDARREHHRLLAARPDPATGSELTMAATSLDAGLVRPSLDRSFTEGRAVSSLLLTIGAWLAVIVASIPLFSVLYMLIVRGGLA